MTNNQLDIVTGSLLGDGSIPKLTRRAKNNLFRLKQSKLHESYVDYVYKKLEDMCASGLKYETSRKPSKINGKICHDVATWDGSYCYSVYFRTRSKPYFTELRNKWYSDGRKIVPCNIKLNPTVLAHWYVEDGSNNVTHKSKGVFLYTNSFHVDECDILCQKLDKYFSFEAKRYGNVIRIMSGSYYNFIQTVKDDIEKFGCFNHKTDISKAPADKVGEIWKGPKLSYEKADVIKSMRVSGASLKSLAEIFNVSISAVGKIVNNQMYKSKITISGSAEVNHGSTQGTERKNRVQDQEFICQRKEHSAGIGQEVWG
jgi:hypothetical protein